ncbi:ribosome-associated heat shock protein Hsp15 [Tolumonas lignilytica]|jgi:Ribosome-associated heat shock protein implicated in the recycling of the 50S subunit (S4 paralog)|uniref:ribosome-associated heat shock protein Hsp15 n=1 Tax=Tolumonas lignilytica TaxID=1283284 RepID=UPI0004642C5B|nr:ribosome-associated heat shock protein Hsp15 [Tolumonas lignilytica]
MPEATENNEVRLDKWLWAARFYKTRALARSMIEGGKVHYNGQRTKPGKQVEVGAVIRIRQGYDDKEIRVLGLSVQRLSAPQAQSLYVESEESIAKRERNAEAYRLNTLFAPHPDSKPDKKQRRDLVRFKQGE